MFTLKKIVLFYFIIIIICTSSYQSMLFRYLIQVTETNISISQRPPTILVEEVMALTTTETLAPKAKNFTRSMEQENFRPRTQHPPTPSEASPVAYHLTPAAAPPPTKPQIQEKSSLPNTLGLGLLATRTGSNPP